MNVNKGNTVLFSLCYKESELSYNESDLYYRVSDKSCFNQISDDFDLYIRGLYRDGYDTFISFISDDFEMIVANAILKAKEECKNIKFIAVVSSISENENYHKDKNECYQKIFNKADEIEVMPADEIKFEYLLKNSSKSIIMDISVNRDAEGDKFKYAVVIV